MTDIYTDIVSFLNHAATRLREAKVPGQFPAQLEQFVVEARQPCVVAVVGQVNAGKSSFINALLGEDLAPVGNTETTATINFFRYGGNYPPYCTWRNDTVESVNQSFIDDLQHHNMKTLQKAEGIKRLEYFLPLLYLQKMTLVDTPGIGSLIDIHQNRTAEFLRLEQQLRDRHAQETEQIGREADAIIYLVGATASVTDQRFVEEFQQLFYESTSVLNAIGVMAKIDLSPETIARRSELASKIADQLQHSLNTVIPVSAGIQRAIDRFREQDYRQLKRMMNIMRRIPPDTLDDILANQTLYEDEDVLADPSSEERKALLDEAIPWMTFVTIARIAARHDLGLDAVVEHLYELAGFKQLKEVLEQHLFERGQFLRCYRILDDTLKLLNTIRYGHLEQLREDENKYRRFLAFLRQAQGDPIVIGELEAFILANGIDQTEQVTTTINTVEEEAEQFLLQLERHNQDFSSLQQIMRHRDLFTREELDEIQPLFGLYGSEIEKRLPQGNVSQAYITERMTVWRQIGELDTQSIRREVAQRITLRYGFLLREVLAMMHTEV